MGQIAGLKNVLGTSESWHIMLACFAPFCAAALFLATVLPESPKYLYIIKGQQGKALKGAYDFTRVIVRRTFVTREFR